MNKTALKEALESFKVKLNALTAAPIEETKVELKQVTTADGLVINVEGEVAAGSKCTTKDAQGIDIPAPDGEYVLESGESIMIAGGVIEAVLPAVATEPVAEDLKKDVAETKVAMAALEVKLTSLINDAATERTALQAKIDSLTSINKELFTIVETLANEPSTEVVEVPVTEKEQIKLAKDERIANLAKVLTNLKK